ncbi:MAG: bifunctional riboflavin kinase/FAD synthetase [Lachnospiraceae bacterium]|nr:bifunctional riboflavin kinase/FAD synthetase [Lachnospiraceae bacterium]
MEIITGTKDFCLEVPTAVAMGKFDGVHIGHRRLLAEILEQKKNGLKACVFTFDPPPAVFFGMSDGKELTTKEEKRQIFEKMGVDILVEFPMNSKTAATEPETFVREVLVRQLKAVFVAAGSDVSFGHRGAGNAKLLKMLAKECRYEVKLIDKICLEQREISSTYVREAVEKGDVKLAARLLGEPYMVKGTVVHGKHLGHTLGFPTVNLVPEKEKLLPPAGVYYSLVQVDEKVYKGVTNVGYKPTVTEEKVCGVETYIYDFDEEIYGKEICVSFCEFKRSEKKFDSLEELKCKIKEDMTSGWKYFENR